MIHSYARSFLTDQIKIILLVFELSGLKARVMKGQKPASPFKRGKAPFAPSPAIPVARLGLSQRPAPVVRIVWWFLYSRPRLIMGIGAVGIGSIVTKIPIRTRDIAASTAMRALSAYVSHSFRGGCLVNSRVETERPC
jgi:hypothetical protein